MEWTEILKIIIAILTGLLTAIPLVIQLVKFVQQAIKERNWRVLLKLIMDNMAEAEKLPELPDGEAKKAYVLSCIAATAKNINYDVDIAEVGNFIDGLCGLTKVVNAR